MSLNTKNTPLTGSSKTHALPALVSLFASSCISSASLADDISVYGSEPNTPRILFVPDYSLSMRQTVKNSTSTKLEVLQETVLELMDTYKDRVEFGIGPMFGATGGGVQWPISDLRIDASFIDSSIPEDKKTGFEVVSDIIQNTHLQWGTATTQALAESALYFQGGPVRFGGIDDIHTLGFKPLQWDTTLNSYAEYNGFSGNAAAYNPSTAYSSGTALSPQTGYCRKQTTPKGNQRIPNDCRNLPAEYTISNCVNAPLSGYTIAGFDYGVIRDTKFGAYEVCEYQHSEEWIGANYISPINNECQANSIIMISDGEPANTISDNLILESIGQEFTSCQAVGASTFEDAQKDTGNCAAEIAAYLATTNQIEGNNKSKVTTNTIGFGIGSNGANYLEDIATAGLGQYLPADNAQELFSAIDELIQIQLPDSQQFANFSVDVDRATFSHDDRAYVPMFKPSDNKNWYGNIKGYFIGDDGLEDVDGVPALENVDNLVRFTEDARSFWSPAADGNSVAKGGATSKLNPPTRNLYTYPNDTVPPQGVDLAKIPFSALDKSNLRLFAHDFGPAHRIDLPYLLDWIREQPMGEALHSNTVIANYDGDQRVVYAMTNQGFLHAIDASTPVVKGDYSGGEELFAFMPRSLWRNIRFMNESWYRGEHIYGLDGSITPWHTDGNNDGIVNEDDTLLLVFGMRRGGKHYYAMDVTDPDNPILAWQITGGITAGFEDLAQTWSKPSLITVKKGDGTERVLVFGGGYDDNIDDKHEATPSSGNSVYMVNSKGEPVWSATHSDMNYGIPSDLRVIDSDGDSVADRLYVGDLGGQIWRIDIDDIATTGSFDVNRLADVSDYGYQPFFYPPSVSRAPNSDKLFVTIGSGNRDNPVKDMTAGAIYMLHDLNPAKGAPDTSFETIVTQDLINITEAASASDEDLQTHKGWVLDLKDGEKSLSPVVTINGDLLATTYQPAVGATFDGCSAPVATRRLYAVRVRNGGAPYNVQTEDFAKAPESRSIELDMAGIPPSPNTLVSKEDSSIDVYIGNEKELELEQPLSMIFFYQK